MAKHSEIAEILNDLTQTYSTQNYSAEPERPDLYYLVLEEYDADILRAAFEDCIRFYKWYPKPAEIREIAERKQREKEQEHEQARVYWRMVDLYAQLLRGEGDAKTEAACIKYFRLDQPAPVLKHHFAPEDIIQYDAEGYPIEFVFEELAYETV